MFGALTDRNNHYILWDRYRLPRVAQTFGRGYKMKTDGDTRAQYFESPSNFASMLPLLP